MCSVSIKGQDVDVNWKSIKPIKKSNEIKDGKVYITHNGVDSTKETIDVFLINRSDSAVFVSGYYGRIEFGLEVMLNEGIWRQLKKHYYAVCATGYEEFQIPSKHYTWERINKWRYKGDLLRKVRFTYTVGDSKISSNPVELHIDEKLLLDPYARLHESIDEVLSDTELPLEVRNRYLVKKSRIYLKNEEPNKAIAFLNEVLNSDSLNYLAKYYLGVAYNNSLTTDKEHYSKSEEIVLINEIINTFSEIPIWHSVHSNATRAIKVYSSYLTTKGEWEEVNDLECKIINGEYRCYLGKHINRFVKMRFK